MKSSAIIRIFTLILAASPLSTLFAAEAGPGPARKPCIWNLSEAEAKIARAQEIDALAQEEEREKERKKWEAEAAQYHEDMATKTARSLIQKNIGLYVLPENMWGIVAAYVGRYSIISCNNILSYNNYLHKYQPYFAWTSYNLAARRDSARGSGPANERTTGPEVSITKLDLMTLDNGQTFLTTFFAPSHGPHYSHISSNLVCIDNNSLPTLSYCSTLPEKLKMLGGHRPTGKYGHGLQEQDWVANVPVEAPSAVSTDKLIKAFVSDFRLPHGGHQVGMHIRVPHELYGCIMSAYNLLYSKTDIDIDNEERDVPFEELVENVERKEERKEGSAAADRGDH